MASTTLLDQSLTYTEIEEMDDCRLMTDYIWSMMKYGMVTQHYASQSAFELTLRSITYVMTPESV